MSTFFLFAGVIASLLIVAHAGGWRIAVASIAIVLLAVFPGREILTLPISMAAILAVAVIGIAASPRVTLPWRFAPLAGYLVLMSLLLWTTSPSQSERIAELMVASCAWTVGAFIAATVDRSLRAERVLVLLLLAIVAVECVVTALQFMGFDIFTSSGTNADLTEGRAAGTHSHPGNLGKVLFLLTMMALPFSLSEDRFVRRIASLAMVASLVPVGLSESRANFLALVALLVAWALFMPRTRGALHSRIVIPGSVLIVGLVFLEPILERFASDPEGGMRARLLDVAIGHIWDNLWLGVGPDMYTAYFGQFDSITASGWPVHNAFILQTAELGLVGAALLFMPLLIGPAIAAFRVRNIGGSQGVYARAVLAAVPGFLIVGITGWSLTSGDIANVLFLSMGFMVTGMRNPAIDSTADHGRISADESSTNQHTERALS